MRERGHGFILNVASTAGFQPGPNMAVYYASKSFVLSFSQSIAEELRSSGIGVTCLCPGPMKTPLYEKSGMSRSRISKSFKPMDPSDVARIAYHGLLKKKVVVIPGRKNKFRAHCSRLFSLRTIRHMMAKITAPLPEKH
jgi:short-subunit dehydrogenase